MRHAHKSLGIGLLVAVALGACAQPAETPTPAAAPTRIPTATFAATGIPTLTRTPLVIYTSTPTIEPVPTRTPSLTPTITLIPTLTSTLPPQARQPSGACDGPIASSNLLANGGFEGGQHNQQHSEINVPDGWAAFWQKEGTPAAYDPQNTDGLQRPEMGVINGLPPYDNPPRIFEGSQAFRMQGNQRAFDAGLWQQVQVKQGATYCVTGSGHAWSSRKSDNPFQSTLEVGDDQRNANFELGIDATGGMDPWSGNIVWGNPAHLYDHYQAINAVQVAAQSNTITIYVRGFMLWRFTHNEMYFDGVSLAQLGP